MTSIEDEARAAFARYVETRQRIDAGELPWTALEDYFTDDVVYIDPAWGRVEGIDAVREFWHDSMMGLEQWSFPEVWTMVDGRRVVSMWLQQMGPGADGGEVAVPGLSILYYAEDGRFCYEHDIMNMAHVMEAITATDWSPSGEFNMPPSSPNRDASLPPHRTELAPGET